MRTIFLLSINNEDLADVVSNFNLPAGDDETAIKLALLRASSKLYTYQIDAIVIKTGEVTC